MDNIFCYVGQIGAILQHIYCAFSISIPLLWQFHMSLSKCSLLFGGYSVKKVLALQFEFDDSQTQNNKNVLISALWWCKLFVMMGCHFFPPKIVFCQETVKKGFFLSVVKLHWPTSENHFSHNLWCNGWISVCFEMLKPSALLWYWPNKTWGLVLGSSGFFIHHKLFIRIFLKC